MCAFSHRHLSSRARAVYTVCRVEFIDVKVIASSRYKTAKVKFDGFEPTPQSCIYIHKCIFVCEYRMKELHA